MWEKPVTESYRGITNKDNEYFPGNIPKFEEKLFC